MLPKHTAGHTAKKGDPRPTIRFPGIVRHARKLGVSRIHLYFVLSGQRTSPPLMRRYRALQSKEQGVAR